MIVGYVRDRFPRVTLQLPGLQGPINIGFIVDTGFDGDLSLPSSLISQIDAAAVIIFRRFETQVCPKIENPPQMRRIFC